jgi:hypothetical protein
MRRAVVQAVAPAILVCAMSACAGRDADGSGPGRAAADDAAAGGDGAARTDGAAVLDATAESAACNLGCAGSAGAVTLHITDSTGQPVPAPTFSEGDAGLEASCAALVDGGVPPLVNTGSDPDGGRTALDGCTAWVFLPSSGELGFGAHTIVVDAPGYATGSIDVNLPYPVACSCSGPSVDASITLAQAPSCGSAICASNEYCIVPCCGGPSLACVNVPDGGACPSGYHADPTCFPGGNPCRLDECPPPPPFCSANATACPMGSGATTSGHTVHCNCQ